MSQLSSPPSAANDVCTITAGPMDTKHSLIFPVPLDRVQWLSPITYAPAAAAAAAAAAAVAATASPSWCASSSSSIEFALIRPDSSPASSSMITPLVSLINPAYAGLRKTYFIPEYIHKRVSYESVEKLFQTSTWLLALEPIAIAIPTNNSNTSSSSSSSSSSYRVIGCLVLDVLSRPNPNPNNTLVGLATILAVSPDQRGTGIASRIMIAAHQYFKREGCTIIEMTVWWPESEANPFDYPSSPSSRLRIWYARLGFRTVMSRYVKDAFPERQAEFLDGIMEDTIQKTINTQTSADATTTAPTAGITLASL